MVRGQRYANDEERQRARQASRMRYQAKLQERRRQKRLDEERKSKTKQVVEDEWTNDEVRAYDMSTRLSIPRPAKDKMRTILSMPAPQSLNGDDNGAAQVQLDKAQQAINDLASGRAVPYIDFSFYQLSPTAQHYIFSKLGDILRNLINVIEFDTRWMVYYYYAGKWRTRPLTEDTKVYLENQLDHEDLITNTREKDSYILEDEYDFFPVMIRSINAMRIVNLDVVAGQSGPILETPADPILRYVSPLTRKKLTKQYEKNEGSFWPYLLKLPGLNLSRQMIFHRLNKETSELMERDNCLIYACKMFGLDEHKLDLMRSTIQTRTFAMSKLREIADIANIQFAVTENNRVRHYGSGPTIIPLLLMNHHYMLNEPIACSPYYIKHRTMLDNKFSKWPLSKRMQIHPENKASISSWPLKHVLDALFSEDLFEPISLGDFGTFSTAMYTRRLKEITNLTYDPQYCCRLKGELKSF